MSATAALALTFPTTFSDPSLPAPQSAGSYVWWRFGDARPSVKQVQDALDLYAGYAGIPWTHGDKVKIAPLSAVRAAAGGFKYNLDNGSVEAKVTYDDKDEAKVCLLRKSTQDSGKATTIGGATVAEIWIGLHSLRSTPVVTAKDAAFDGSSPTVRAFLADLHKERTTVGYLTIRPTMLLPALKNAQAIGQKSRAGFYWCPDKGASKICALAAFMKAVNAYLHIIPLRKDEGTVAAIGDGSRLHITDLIDEVKENVVKLRAQVERGRSPRSDSVESVGALFLEIEETAEIVRESLGLRMEDLEQALASARADFRAIIGEPKAEPTPAPAEPKKRTPRAPETAPAAPVESAPSALEQAPEPTLEPEPFAQDSEPLAPVSDAQEVIADPVAQEVSPEPEPSPVQEQVSEPASIVVLEPVAVLTPATLEPEPVTEEEGIAWPSDEGLKKLNRDALRLFFKDARIKALYEARGVKGVMNFNPDQLRNLIILLRDGE